MRVTFVPGAPAFDEVRNPIWKCVWCREHLGKVTEVQAKLLESYVKKFGWPSDPLIFHEDGGIYAYGSKV